MESGCLKFMQSIIKALVLSTPEKMTVDKLNRDYRASEGENIPFQKMGYKTLEAFLRSMPDVVQVCGSGSTAIVINVANCKTKHIAELVKGQKKTKKNVKSKPLPPRNMYPFSNGNYSFQRPNFVMSNMQSYGHNINNNMRHGNPRRCVELFTRSVQHAQSVGFTRNTNGFLDSTNRTFQSNTKASSSGQQYTANISMHQQHISSNQLETERLITQFQHSTLKEQPKNTALPQSKVESHTNVHSWHVANGANRYMSNESRNQDLYLSCNSSKLFEPKPMKDQLNEETSTEMFSQNASVVSIKTIDVEQQIDKKSEKADVPCNSIHTEQQFDRETVEADEAIPDFALICDVFLADFPVDVANYGMDFLLPELPPANSVIAVHLAQIQTPDKFYFNIHKEEDELEILRGDMQYFYEILDKHAYRMPLYCIRTGLICAVRLNGVWQRAKVLAPPNAKKRINVYFVDIGITCDVALHEIKFLLKLYAELPAQALCGRLANLKSSSQDGNWSSEAVRFFKMLTFDRVLYGLVTAVDGKISQMDLILCDTTGTVTKQINSSLISERFAIYNEQ